MRLEPTPEVPPVMVSLEAVHLVVATAGIDIDPKPELPINLEARESEIPVAEANQHIQTAYRMGVLAALRQVGVRLADLPRIEQPGTQLMVTTGILTDDMADVAVPATISPAERARRARLLRGY